MERKLLVTLLKNNIQELDLLTEGFLEMEHYPESILLLARRKMDEIVDYLDQLAALPGTPIAVESDTAAWVVEGVSEATSDFELSDEVIQEAEELLSIESVVSVNEQTIVVEPDLAKSSFEDVALESMVAADAHLSVTLPLNDLTEAVVSLSEADDRLEEGTETEDVSEMKPTFLSQKASQQNAATRNETLMKASDLTLGEALANKKITDIKQAMSLGDRFRFQRELFNGNGEDMNKTISYINLLVTFEEASSFLQSKYKWELENPTVEDFYRILHRKF